MEAKQISYDEAIRRGIAPGIALDPNSLSASDEHFREGVAQAGQMGIDPLIQLQNMMGMKDIQLSRLDSENGKLREVIQERDSELLKLYRLLHEYRTQS